MAAWILRGTCVGEEAGARNLAFFLVKWLQAAMKGTSCVRRVCGRFIVESVLSWCSATCGDYRVFWNLCFWKLTDTSATYCRKALLLQNHFAIILVRQCGPRVQTPWRSDLASSWSLQSTSNCWIFLSSATWALLRQLRMLMYCRALTWESCCNAK